MPLDTGGQIRFASENLLKTQLNFFNVSSELASAPKANSLTDFRNRPFIFGGRFTITTSNNLLYFNDGSDKVATIAVGEYTSPGALCTAIQTALNAVSSGFTVTYLGSYKFKIARSSSFTARYSQTTNAIWETIGVMSITDTVASGSPVAVVSDELRAHYPSEDMTIDFGFNANIGFLALIGPSSKAFTLSPGAVINVRANTLNDFTSPPVNVNISFDERGAFKFFDDDEYAYRFWKITITDPTNPLGNNGIEIGNFFLGEYVKFNDRYNAQGATNVINDRSVAVESESGVTYFDQKTKARIYKGIQIEAMNPANKEVLVDLYKRFGKSEAFYISIDPKLEISLNLSDYTFFSRFTGEPEFTHILAKLYNTVFEVKEVL